MPPRILPEFPALLTAMQAVRGGQRPGQISACRRPRARSRLDALESLVAAHCVPDVPFDAPHEAFGFRLHRPDMVDDLSSPESTPESASGWLANSAFPPNRKTTRPLPTLRPVRFGRCDEHTSPARGSDRS